VRSDGRLRKPVGADDPESVASALNPASARFNQPARWRPEFDCLPACLSARSLLEGPPARIAEREQALVKIHRINIQRPPYAPRLGQ
jgi:hypothetical protein